MNHNLYVYMSYYHAKYNMQCKAYTQIDTNKQILKDGKGIKSNTNPTPISFVIY